MVIGRRGVWLAGDRPPWGEPGLGAIAEGLADVAPGVDLPLRLLDVDAQIPAGPDEGGAVDDPALDHLADGLTLGVDDASELGLGDKLG